MIDIIKLLLNIALCLHIHRRGGIVKHKDRRILQKCSRQRNTLLLSTGQTNAALTDDGIIAVRKLLNKQISICHLCHFLDAFKAAVRLTICDIALDGVRKKKHILHRNTDIITQLIHVVILYINAIDKYLAVSCIKETAQKIDHC